MNKLFAFSVAVLVLSIAIMGNAVQAESIPVCGGSDDPLEVDLDWTALPREDSIMTPRDDLWLRITSAYPKNIVGHFTAHLNIAGRERRLDLGKQILRPKVPLKLKIKTRDVPRYSSAYSSSASLQVSVHVTDARRGVFLGNRYAPTLFFHSDTEGLVYYRAGALLTRFGGGDWSGRFRGRPNRKRDELFQHVGPGLRGNPGLGAIPEGNETAPFPDTFALPGTKPGPWKPAEGYTGPRQVCVLLRTGFVDAAIGDHMTDELVPALGVRYVLAAPYQGI